MIKIDTTIAKKSGYLGEVRFSAVDCIPARIVLKSTASYDKSRVRNYFMCSSGLLVVKVSQLNLV